MVIPPAQIRIQKTTGSTTGMLVLAGFPKRVSRREYQWLK